MPALTVLSVQGMAERGGSDQALLRMVRTLPRADFTVHVAVPAPHPLRAEFEAAGARLHVVPMRRISTSHGLAAWLGYALVWPVSVLRMVALGRRLRVDVVHTNSLHFWQGWAVAALLRRPHVWHARELVGQSGPALRVERLLTRHGADLVVAVSQAVADQLDPRRLVVAHDHPDPAEFHPGRAGSARAAEGLPDDAPLVGVVGRLDTWKGLEVALDAFALVRAALPDARLVVAGTPVEGKRAWADALRAKAVAQPGVHWLGARDDVPDLVADLDVLLLASTTPEPYGLVVVEALASGVPVVATEGGGPPEIFAAARPGAGRLVPPGDAAATAAALVEVLRARRARDAAGRRARPVLSQPGPPPFADLLRSVAASLPG